MRKISKSNMKSYIKQRDNLLKQIKGIQPFIYGSVVKIAHTCGNVNCKCMKGAKHVNYYLTYKLEQKTRTKYIPVEMEKEVHKWSEEYKQLKVLINKISELQIKIIKQYGLEKRKTKKQKGGKK